MSNLHKYFITLSIILTTPPLIGQWGVVCVPVADMILESADNVQKNNMTKDFYRNLTLTVECGSYPRAHQLLYNEVVTILESKKNEVHVRIDNITYAPSDVVRSKRNTFWTLRDNIMSDQACHKLNLTKKNFPTPLACTLHNKSSWAKHKTPSQDHIVLTLPWHCSQTNSTYSAGTRFLREPNFDTDLSYGVTLVNWQVGSTISRQIPKNKSRIETLSHKSKAQKEFIDLLKRWLKEIGSDIIPYVWGGSSFVHSYQNVKPKLAKIKNIKQWVRPEKHRPHTGYDCSEMILRAAQICGIPYPYKTSSLIEQNLEALKADEKITEGDIIWYSGHVMIVSDLAHNKMIEARGYANGYGKIHEVSLNTIFHEITTYDQLLAWSHKQKPLSIYNSDGSLCRTVTNYKILKLRSVWC